MPQVQSPCVESMADAKVKVLIKEDIRQWDHGLIEGLFTPKEVELIKSIPFSRCEVEDTLFWPFTSSGVYTSKSGYRFLNAEEHTMWDEEQRELDKRPPNLDVIKINCDGVIFKEQKKSFIGVVIRDSNSSVMALMSKLLSQQYTPLEIEALAASTALEFAAELGFSQAVLETDS
ncbi:hypothetical protein CMV_011458 [Castanea mollissima]|uniref:RNase H type-1 domain-containing protein n=1 Tax=Castanea mollissima TaxID=60419 RepID=A0A8J4RGM0_9ROSI|nr:hypothetical protein CMV_011458 [Castanea mollissima]